MTIWVVKVNSGGRVCEGGQVWGHARRRGYAAAEIWPKSDLSIGCVQIVPGEGGRWGGEVRGGGEGGKSKVHLHSNEWRCKFEHHRTWVKSVNKLAFGTTTHAWHPRSRSVPISISVASLVYQVGREVSRAVSRAVGRGMGWWGGGGFAGILSTRTYIACV